MPLKPLSYFIGNSVLIVKLAHPIDMINGSAQFAA